MAITIAVFASTGTTIGTITSLVTNTAGPDSETSDGMFQPFIHCPAAATAADIFTVKFWETIDATQVILWEGSFRGRGAAFGWVGPSMLLGVGWDITIEKAAGTDRTIEWHINKAA
jgi:hypothetical protein